MISYAVWQHGVLCEVKLKNSTRNPSAISRSPPVCVRENECATMHDTFPLELVQRRRWSVSVKCR